MVENTPKFEPEKQASLAERVWSEIRGFCEEIREFSSTLFQPRDSAWGNIKLLPENLRFALSHKGCQFGVSEIQTVIKRPWNGSGVYLLLKYLDDYPDLQQEVMKQIFESIRSTGDFKESREYMSRFLENLPANFKEHTINGTKISQLCRHGWTMETNLEDAIARIPKDRVVFVVAYAGLLGIRPMIQSLKPDERFVIYLEKAENPEKFCGYRVQLEEDDEFTIQPIAVSQLKGTKITLLDDTYNTGGTVEGLASDLLKKIPNLDINFAVGSFSKPPNPNSSIKSV
jgi:adenine/guanine phosphoribosyltransferase-like PRPP-binding protein